MTKVMSFSPSINRKKITRSINARLTTKFKTFEATVLT